MVCEGDEKYYNHDGYVIHVVCGAEEYAPPTRMLKYHVRRTVEGPFYKDLVAFVCDLYDHREAAKGDSAVFLTAAARDCRTAYCAGLSLHILDIFFQAVSEQS